MWYDFSSLSSTEIDEKIRTVQDKRIKAARASSFAIVEQLEAILESLLEERRTREAHARARKQAASSPTMLDTSSDLASSTNQKDSSNGTQVKREGKQRRQRNNPF